MPKPSNNELELVEQRSGHLEIGRFKSSIAGLQYFRSFRLGFGSIFARLFYSACGRYLRARECHEEWDSASGHGATGLYRVRWGRGMKEPIKNCMLWRTVLLFNPSGKSLILRVRQSWILGSFFALFICTINRAGPIP